MRLLALFAVLALPAAAAAGNLAAPPAPGSLVVDVLSPDVLALLERRGYGFPQIVDGQALGESAAWRSIATVLAEDSSRLEAALRGVSDPGHAFRIRRFAFNSAEAYEIERNGDAPRQFDPRWFRSPFSYFQLIAVVNRYDRRDFDAASPCGELRFVYRLAYRAGRYRSSLPFFVNVVMRADPAAESCAASLQRWVAPGGLDAPARVADWLLAGPLATPRALKQVEVNFQSLRFSAGYMRDFGGQALYVQRVFRPDVEGTFAPVALENTPDADAVRRDPRLRERLLAFVTEPENLRRLDEGTLVLPDFEGRFLAKRAISYSTMGRARLANKPFRDMLLARDGKGRPTGRLDPAAQAALAKIDFSRLRFVKSPAAVVERLDNLSCMGCHQSGGTAGFHLLGLGDDRVSDSFNQVELPFSPHYAAERVRRIAYVGEATAGRLPDRFRPHSFFPAAAWTADGPRFSSAEWNGQCLPDAAHFGLPLSCAPSHACELVASNALLDVQFGDCIARDRPVSGSACRAGRVETAGAPGPPGDLPSSTFGFLDTFRETGVLHPNLAGKVSSDRLNCRPASIGVPLGRTFRRCTASEKRLDELVPLMKAGAASPDTLPREICAAVGGTKFEECAQGNDVLSCLRGAVTRGMVDTCAPGRSCREDYVCQRIPRELPGVADPARVRWLNENAVGFCTPTYFLFNMRADGHPDPTTGAAEKLDPARRATEVRGGFAPARVAAPAKR